MYELRVVALSQDGRHVVLAPILEGRRERYAVAIDDRLRSALRGELGRMERRSRPESALRPREMQARMRAGESAESVAEAAGVTVEWVLRFEAPVLAERAQVARQARCSSLSVSGGEWTGVPLEEVVAARLGADGHQPAEAEWDSWRREDGRWVVSVRAGRLTAQWLWDPALQRLVVHDEAARTMTESAAQHDEDSSSDARVIHLAPPVDGPPPSRLEGAEEPTLDLADALADPLLAGLAFTGPGGDDVTDAGEPAAAEHPRGAKRRRKAVPSWEDILLGTGTGTSGPTG